MLVLVTAAVTAAGGACAVDGVLVASDDRPHRPADADASQDAGVAVDAHVEAGRARTSCERFFDIVLAKKLVCSKVTLSAKRLADLEAWFVRRCEADLAAPGTSFTPAFVEACSASLVPLACDPAFSAQTVGIPGPVFTRSYEPTPACRLPAGGLAIGTTCERDSQCATGWCRTFNSPPGACGTCQATLAKDAGCAGVPVACEIGTRCHFPEGSCHDIGYAVGDFCTSQFDCGQGLRCDTASGQCRSLGAAGESINANGVCPSPAGPSGCRPELGCSMGACVARQPAAAACTSLPCELGLGCSAGRCEALTYVPNEAACSAVTAGSIHCADGYCQWLGESGLAACQPDPATDCASDASAGDAGGCALVTFAGCPSELR